MNLLLWGALWFWIQQPAATGINFFSLQQDIEIGEEASDEAELTLPLVRDANLNRYLRSVGQRLATMDSLPDFQYRFRIVNSPDINSFGFPGGAIYVNRGLIEKAANENELAAILAHEIAHVSGRHGTSQLSRQLLVQAPITIAAGLPTTNDGWRNQLTKLGVSFGARASFLRYSRDQELQASRTAVRLLYAARFDPAALGALLQKVNEADDTEELHLPEYVFNHPQPDTLAAQIEAEIERVTTTVRHPRVSGEFRTFHTALAKLPYPEIEEKAVESDAPEDPLTEVFTHRLDYYQFRYPAGWRVTPNGENGTIIAPSDGIEVSRMRDDDINRGVIVDFMDLGDRQLTLEDATNRLIVHFRQRNQSLKVIPGTQTHTLISDEPGLRMVLVGKDRVTDPQEVVWVVTRMYYRTLFYMIFVAPENEFADYQPVFESMIRSARLR